MAGGAGPDYGRAALSWPRHRIDTALDHTRTYPDAGGVLLLRHVPPETYTVTQRLDILDTYQVDALTGREKPHAAVRGPIQPAEAEVLLRVWVDGGIDPHDAAQRQALEDLVAAEMVNPGGIGDPLHDNLLYSLLGLLAPSLPTDNNSAFPLS
ncbi:hypothetical protein [Streptomyces sp. NPDC060333]|uniref:hypothetical protein n=1 Tax=Streptomyces sp. NPDC060333 TaxID=3347098 RepID=UPI00365A6339